MTPERMAAQEEYIKAELDGLFDAHEGDAPKFLCMLKLYLDESIDDGTGMCVVAGFLGTKRQWSDYLKAWPETLKPRKSIHVSDLRLGWRGAPRRYGSLLASLGEIPAKCRLRAFSSSICRKDYADRISGTALELLMEQGYVQSILALMDELVKNIHPNERVEVVFEAQEIHAILRERAMILWHKLHRTTSGWSVLAKWSSMPKCTLTEAPDYLCYAMQQSYLDPGSQKASLTTPILKHGVITVRKNKEEIDAMLRRVALSYKNPKLTPEIRNKSRSR
ncbi:MAG: hypothetical protein ABSD98_01750 [Candidatus Korobacteraceae bacterium]|jgi:hypothetical protein